MIAKIIPIIFLMLLSRLCFAQSNELDCKAMMAEGDRLSKMEDRDLNKVLTAYLNALTCDARLALQLGPKIQDVFKQIEEQKKAEAAARKQAEDEKKRADQERDNAKKAQARAEEERDRADQRTIEATASSLTAQARSITETDPTTALNLVYEAMSLSASKEAVETFRHVSSPGRSYYQQQFILGDRIDRVMKMQVSRDQQYMLLYYSGYETYLALINLVTRDTQMLTGYDNYNPPVRIVDAVLGDDSRFVFVATSSGIIRGELGSEKKTTILPEEYIFAFDVFRDSLMLVSYRKDDEYLLQLWEMDNHETFHLKREYRVESSTDYIKFSPDGQHFVSIDSKDKLFHWSINQTSPIQSYIDVEDIQGISLKADGKSFVSYESNGSARLWHLGSSQPIDTLKFNNDFGNHGPVAISHDGQYVLTVDGSNAKLWSVNNLKGDPLRTYIGTVGDIEQVAFSEDDRFVYTASRSPLKYDHIDVASGNTMEGTGIITVRVWPIHSTENMQVINNVHSLSFLPGEEEFINLSKDRNLQFWHTGDTKPYRSVSLKEGITSDSVVISPNGKYYVTILESRYDKEWTDAYLKIWQVENQELVATIPIPIEKIGYDGSDYFLKFSPNSLYLACCYRIIESDGLYKAIIWSIMDHKKIKEFDLFESIKRSMAFSPDSKLFVAGPDSLDFARVWNIKSGREEGYIIGYSREDYTDYSAGDEPPRDGRIHYGFSNLSFTPSGNLVAVHSNMPDSIRIWNPGTHQIIRSFQMQDLITGGDPSIYNSSSVNHLCLTTDGRFALTATTVVQLWDVASGAAIRDFRLPIPDSITYQITSIGFLSDNTKIYCTTDDNRTFIWNNPLYRWDPLIYRLKKEEFDNYLPASFRPSSTNVNKSSFATLNSRNNQKNGYGISLASFSDMEKALKRKNELEKRGLKNLLIWDYVSADGKIYKRVVQGPFPSKSVAEQKRKQLKNTYSVEGFLVQVE